MPKLPFAQRFLPLAARMAAIAASILVAGGAAQAAIIIDNGLDCSNPGNVIDQTTGDGVWVLDAPAGGPTEVCLVDGGFLGGTGDLGIFDSSSVTMSGGTVGDAVTARDLSTFTMSGGSVPGGLYSEGSASVTMSGGLVDSTLFASGESSLTIRDGTLAASSIYARDSSTVTIFGSDFEVDEAPVPLGVLSAPRGTLTGTLPSGDSFYSVFYHAGASCGATTCTGTITLASPSAVEVCTDGIDNDGDGLADFDDPDCSSPRPFEYPVSNAIVGQDFDNLDPVLGYHTGLDLEGDPEIHPIGPGTVVLKQLNDVGCQPPPVVGDCADHGMGNTVVVQHSSETIGAFYSLYAHLDSIDAQVEVGVSVDESSALGVMGGSGYGQPDYWSVHLHFETKTQPVLHNGLGTRWEYTGASALGYIYLDPVPILESDAANPPLTEVPPGTGEASALGGSDLPGGVDVDFESTGGGILFAEVVSAPEDNLEQATGVDLTAFPFVFSGGPVQVWTLGFDGPSSGSVELTFGYADSTSSLLLFQSMAAAGSNSSDLVLYQFVGNRWSPLEGTIDETARTITVTVDSLSTFMLGTSQRISLPALSTSGYLALVSCLIGFGLAYGRRRAR